MLDGGRHDRIAFPSLSHGRFDLVRRTLRCAGGGAEMSVPMGTEQVNAAACDRLLRDLLEFMDRRGAELGLDNGMSANVMTSAVACTIVHMHLPKDASRTAFDEAMRELLPRIYDAGFSIKDWIERKVPWRMQSQFMRKSPGVVMRLGKKGLDS